MGRSLMAPAARDDDAIGFSFHPFSPIHSIECAPFLLGVCLSSIISYTDEGAHSTELDKNSRHGASNRDNVGIAEN